MAHSAPALALPPTAGRDQRVESLRGLAIVLLVLYHAIDVYHTHVPALAWMKGLIEPFIMPTFAVISGYVYALKPVRREYLRRFVVNKFNRIAVPMLIAATGLYLLRGVVIRGQPVGDVWRVWLFSYDYFWFLQALLLVFAVIAVVDVLRLADKRWSWLIVLIVAFQAQRWIPGSNVFSLWGLLYLLPSFLIGLGLQRFGTERSERRTLLYAVVVAVVAIAIYQLGWFGVLSNVYLGRTGSLAQALGISLTIALILRCPRVGGLVWLAALSYSIYLYHGLGLAFGERLGRLVPGAATYWAALLLKFALGLAIPIAMGLLLRWSTSPRRAVPADGRTSGELHLRNGPAATPPLPEGRGNRAA